VSGRGAAPEPALYGERIVVPLVMSAPLKAAVEDLASHLKQMTGRPFEVDAQEGARGLVLRLLRESERWTVIPDRNSRTAGG
jgi:hypothetical protein